MYVHVHSTSQCDIRSFEVMFPFPSDNLHNNILVIKGIHQKRKLVYCEIGVLRSALLDVIDSLTIMLSSGNPDQSQVFLPIQFPSINCCRGWEGSLARLSYIKYSATHTCKSDWCFIRDSILACMLVFSGLGLWCSVEVMMLMYCHTQHVSYWSQYNPGTNSLPIDTCTRSGSHGSTQFSFFLTCTHTRMLFQFCIVLIWLHTKPGMNGSEFLCRKTKWWPQWLYQENER